MDDGGKDAAAIVGTADNAMLFLCDLTYGDRGIHVSEWICFMATYSTRVISQTFMAVEDGMALDNRKRVLDKSFREDTIALLLTSTPGDNGGSIVSSGNEVLLLKVERDLHGPVTRRRLRPLANLRLSGPVSGICLGWDSAADSLQFYSLAERGKAVGEYIWEKQPGNESCHDVKPTREYHTEHGLNVSHIRIIEALKVLVNFFRSFNTFLTGRFRFRRPRPVRPGRRGDLCPPGRRRPRGRRAAARPDV